MKEPAEKYPKKTKEPEREHALQFIRFAIDNLAYYYHHWRPHQGLEMDAPAGRAVQSAGQVVEAPEIFGLHHHYERRAA